MNHIRSFFQLIRWINLLFIVITQTLFYLMFIEKPFRSAFPADIYNPFSGRLLLLVELSSVFIAMGGYLINDYFDQKVDAINKPDRLYVGRIIPGNTVMGLYLAVSFLGLIFSYVISLMTANWYIVILNFVAILLLYVYSVFFKHRLLSGNFIVSILTAWVVMIFPVIINGSSFKRFLFADDLMMFSWIYGGFAFLLSTVREAVKDAEDKTGDAVYGSTTLPVVCGIDATKLYTGILIMLLMLPVIYLTGVTIVGKMWGVMAYTIILIVTPLIYVLKKLYIAAGQHDFHHLSLVVKLIMLTGVLSMIFF